MNTRGLRPAQERGGGYAAAHPRVRRAGYGPAPPASRLLRIADATALRAGPDPGDLCGPPGRKRGQAMPAPPGRAAHRQHHQIGSLYGSRGLPADVWFRLRLMVDTVASVDASRFGPCSGAERVPCMATPV